MTKHLCVALRNSGADHNDSYIPIRNALSLILLSACGRHWIVSDTPIQSAIGQAPALKPRAAGDLRLALVDCAEKFEHDRSYQLNGVSDDNLVASFANEGATFDNCMRAKGWVTFPDVLLAP